MSANGDLIKKVVTGGQLRPQTVFQEDPEKDAPDPLPIPSMDQITAALAEKRDASRRKLKALGDTLEKALEIVRSMDV